jgi:hypothetical protein
LMVGIFDVDKITWLRKTFSAEISHRT